MPSIIETLQVDLERERVFDALRAAFPNQLPDERRYPDLESIEQVVGVIRITYVPVRRDGLREDLTGDPPQDDGPQFSLGKAAFFSKPKALDLANLATTAITLGAIAAYYFGQ